MGFPKSSLEPVHLCERWFNAYRASGLRFTAQGFEIEREFRSRAQGSLGICVRTYLRRNTAVVMGLKIESLSIWVLGLLGSFPNPQLPASAPW